LSSIDPFHLVGLLHDFDLSIDHPFGAVARTRDLADDLASFINPALPYKIERTYLSATAGIVSDWTHSRVRTRQS
jgi:hypothetical protein